VVDVTDRADVAMRLRAVEFFLSHDFFSLSLDLAVDAYIGNG
jgi:hypothetical protein